MRRLRWVGLREKARRPGDCARWRFDLLAVLLDDARRVALEVQLVSVIVVGGTESIERYA